jgi:uncharacterized protein (DUF427 family)
MSTPPVHNARTVASDATWTVSREGTVLARSSSVVMVHEHYDGTDLPAVPYFPLADVDRDLLTATDHETVCPIKGAAAYYSVAVDGQASDDLVNSVWYYPTPMSPLEAIEHHVGFYGDRFEISSD